MFRFSICVYYIGLRPLTGSFLQITCPEPILSPCPMLSHTVQDFFGKLLVIAAALAAAFSCRILPSPPTA